MAAAILIKVVPAVVTDLTTGYLDLMREVLIGRINRDMAQAMVPMEKQDKPRALSNLARRLRGRPVVTAMPSLYDESLRDRGMDWPLSAFSMIGAQRMDNLRALCTAAIRDGIAGDFVETGVWRGGACIFMRGVLFAHGVTDRTVWVCDSFEGLPPPDPAYPADKGQTFHEFGQLAISVEEVQENFRRFGLLDGQVRFLKGWFKDTLPAAPIDKVAVLRLDGDLYQSTMDALTALYPRVSAGGYVIVDDYGVIPPCKAAVHDYLDSIGQGSVTIRDIDGVGVWFQKG